MEKSFSKTNGFGKHEHIAIKLLKKTISMLNHFNINYFLISGTLLGYMRHNDFIPWDDDIDLIVDHKILDLLPNIYEKYGKKINIIAKDGYIVKTCFNDKVNIIEHKIKKHIINNDNNEKNYCWPFIDMFIYTEKNDYIYFFHKKWNKKHFFPPKQVMFKGINTKIPINPIHFLRINYGYDCMRKYVSSSYNHKEELEIETCYTTFDKKDINTN